MNKTVRGDSNMYSYRLRTGCPSCGEQLVLRVRMMNDDGESVYAGDYYTCPRACTSPLTGTRYTLSHPKNGVARETNMGDGTFKQRTETARPSVVKRTATGNCVLRRV